MRINCDDKKFKDTSINGIPQFNSKWRTSNNDELIDVVIENSCSEFINQIQLVGQDKKCLTALVVPNVELVKSKFLEEDLSKLNLNKNIGTFFKSQINILLKSRLGARSEEQILDCYFVDAFTLENGLLTQTLKQKRKEIEREYSLQIENMYEQKFSKKN